MNVPTITFLLISTLCFSQKQYEFDYLIEYEFTLYKDSVRMRNRSFIKNDKTITKYYFTNSKKNNYTAVITEFDSLNYAMNFKDENGIRSNVNFLKSDLNKAEYIHIECKDVRRYNNPYKYQTNNYAFFKQTDTLIDKKSYTKYKLTSIRPRRKNKRIKPGTEFYIIDKETLFHLPILTIPTAYEEWKTTGNLPNGIFFEKYFIDYFGHLHSKEKLVTYRKIDKKIVIGDDCDYTKKK